MTSLPETARGDRTAETHVTSQLVELDRGTCIALLADTNFGRLAVSLGGRPPLIRPVNYVFDDRSQSVVFRTALGSKFGSLVRATNAAFEIDGIDEATRTGWSVIVSGVTEEIVDRNEIHRLTASGLDPWAPGHKHFWMRIRAFTVSGRRIRLGGIAVSS